MRVLKGLNLDYVIRNNHVRLNKPQITFSEEELTDKFRSIPRESLMDRFWFWLGSSAVYHFDNGDGLVFMELKPGFYTPAISDSKKAGRDYCGPVRPFCSDQQ